MKHFTRYGAPWLFEDTLQTLLGALCRRGEEARVVGGAVRNTLLGKQVADVDIATTAHPEITKKRAQSIGARVLLTGMKFGTLTVVFKNSSYEVTTLRTDKNTDGRYAKVRFGKDWKADAIRRDFTINALYVDRFGKIYDEMGCGLHDIENRILRFIGDAEERIKEDYLRILRFFRFFAWYGCGRPDKQGLKAIAHLKKGLSILSSERVWNEMKKLLHAPNPSRSLLWMRQSGVLTYILPELRKWGINLFSSLLVVERQFLLEKDPILRLATLILPIPEQIKSLSERLGFSSVEKKRLFRFTLTSSVRWDMSDHEIRKQLYREGREAIWDQLFLTLARLQTHPDLDQEKKNDILKRYNRFVNLILSWPDPIFPVKGRDLVQIGFVQGVTLGRTLDELKEVWISSDFQENRETLLKLALSHRNSENNA